jgi:hypothetical protein
MKEFLCRSLRAPAETDIARVAWLPAFSDAAGVLHLVGTARANRTVT